MNDIQKNIEEQKIENQVKSGQVKRVSIDIIETFDKILISDDNKYLTKDILENYKTYLELLNKLKEYKPSFIKVLKEQEILRNQSLEGIDRLIVDVFMKHGAPSTTEQLIEDKKYGSNYTKNDFIKSHSKLLLGVCSPNIINEGIRTRNLSYVNKKENDKIVVDYIPVDYKDIEKGIDYILKIYNNKNITNETDILIKPIMIHGLIAALQMFKDGNTRLARIYENIMIWDLSNKIYNFEQDPSIYISEAIYKYADRSEYRKLISNIAINPNIDTLNKWIEYNLLLIEKQIFLNRDKIEKIYPTIKKIIR